MMATQQFSAPRLATGTLAKGLILLCCAGLISGCGGSGGSGGSGSADNNPATGAGGPGAGSATPAPTNRPSGNRNFGSPNNSNIRPGVTVNSADGSCTSNFLYTADNRSYFIGAAAHCFSPDTNSGIDPCATGNQVLGSAVAIENANFPGQLAYSSWSAMQQNGETVGSDICASNDFALIRIDDRDLGNIHPAVVIYGGPTDLLEGLAAVNDRTYSYGQSPLHFGVGDLQEKEGPIVSISSSGWIYTVSNDNPGLPGDSGSAVLHESGEALGVLSVVGTCVGLCPAVSNGIVNLDLALDYANRFMNTRLRVETWSDFSP